jgi:hypothetical protein
MFFGGLAVTIVHTPQDLLRGFGLAAFLLGMFYALLIWLPQMLLLMFQSRVVIDGTTLFVRRRSGWERIDLRSIDKILLAPQRETSFQSLAGKSFTHVYGVSVATFSDPARDDLVNPFLLSFEALRRVAGMLPPNVELRMGSFLAAEELIVAHIFATARANQDHTSWSLLGTKELKAFSALCAGRPAPQDVALVRYAYGAVQHDPVGSDGAVTSAGGGHDQNVMKSHKKFQRKALLIQVAAVLIYVFGQNAADQTPAAPSIPLPPWSTIAEPLAPSELAKIKPAVTEELSGLGLIMTTDELSCSGIMRSEASQDRMLCSVAIVGASRRAFLAVTLDSDLQVSKAWLHHTTVVLKPAVVSAALVAQGYAPLDSCDGASIIIVDGLRQATCALQDGSSVSVMTGPDDQIIFSRP